MTRRTPTQYLASDALGQDVIAWAAEVRAAGASWRLIASELRERTDGRVDVTGESIRLWVTGAAEAEAVTA